MGYENLNWISKIKDLFKEKTSSISKKRRLGRENCDDIQFMKNNVKLPKQEITDDEKFPTFIKTPAGNFKKGLHYFSFYFSF